MKRIQFKKRALLAVLAIVPVIVWAQQAQDPKTAWMNKQVTEWTEQDASNILINSPWSKKVGTVLTPLQSEFERREGGNMGRPHGVGYDKIESKNTTGKSDGQMIFLPPRSKDGLGAMGTMVQLRWETAMPIRLAEIKAHFQEPPVMDGDGYVLAVYGVPGRDFNGDPAKLGEPLKKTALLRRTGKKDIKPIRVEVFQGAQDLTVAYMFSRSDEITKNDKFVVFHAQIGRFIIQQSWDVDAMRFQGKLEL